MKNLLKFLSILTILFTSVVTPSIANDVHANTEQFKESVTGLEQSIKDKNWTNAALYSARIAKYYDDLKDYDKAVKYYEDAASYWGKTANPSWGIQYINRANEIRTEIEVYIEKNVEFGHTLAKYEPVSGLYLGLYTAGDLESPKVGEMDFKKVEELYGKNHAMYLTYTNWTKDGVTFPTAYAERVKSVGSALQIALQPLSGLDAVTDTEEIREFARQAQAMNMPIFIRFAGEMNGDWAHWYDKTGKKFIEKFRLVHDIFEQEAPNVAMVWAPNFYPYNNFETYYPGDKYVDWVGLSLYMSPYSAGQKKEVLGNTPITYLKIISDLYPHKPLMYAEGAIAHYSHIANKDYTAWANNQLHLMYEVAPKMIPNLKAITYFNLDKRNTQVTGDNQNNNFDIGKNKTYYNTYKSIIKQDHYIDTLTLETSNNTILKDYTSITKLKEGSGKHEAFVYAKLPLGKVPTYIVAYQNNVKVAQSNEAPWKMVLDLNALDPSKPLKITAFDASWKVLGSKEIKLNYKKVKELSHFSDVSATHWAFKDINEAVKNNILNGYQGKFSPQSLITIRDFTTILARSYGKNDELIKYTYPTGVQQFMRTMNYPHVSTNSSTITRVQAAEIIAASQGYNLTGDDAIKYLLVNNLSQGKVANEISVENYDGAATLSRAEAVRFIANVKNTGKTEIEARPSVETDPSDIGQKYTEMFE